MNKIYYLKTCDTCKRILKKIKEKIGSNKFNSFKFQEIKSESITVIQLEEMFNLSKSYEALFNKRAKKYTKRGLKNENLTEQDYKSLILEEYTFLKRPVIIYENDIFIGNNKKVLAQLFKKFDF